MTKSQWFDEGNPDFPLVPVYLLGKKNANKNKGMKENNLLSLSYGSIIRKNIDDTGGLRPDSFETYQVVQPGDTVLRFTDLQNDHKSLRSGLVTEKGIITSAYIGFRPYPQMINPAYFAYTMRALDGMKAFYEMGSGVRQSLNWEEFSALYMPLPDLETQRRIADYLDKEISEMDALIEEFEGLVRELETRKALLPDSKINHQGLSVQTVPAKLLSRIKTGEGDTQDALEDGEFPFYVRSDTVRASDRWTFEGPAVLTSGDGAGVGKIFHYTEGKFRAHQRVYVLMDFANVYPKYFYWCFQTNFPRQVEHGGAKATVESVRMNMVADTPIPLPPLEKQQEIADELDREFERMDALIEESTHLIENLKARKTALITEVVTGRKEV